MALTARNTVGFEAKYNKAGFPTNPVPYEVKQNVAISMGRLMTIANPAAAINPKATALTSTITVNKANCIVGVTAEAITQANNPTTAKTNCLIYDTPYNVYTASFAGHVDGTAQASTIATQLKTGIGTLTTAANAVAGALVHIYEGPGKGDVRTVASNSTLGVLTVAPAFSAIPTVATKYILLSALSTASKLQAASVNVGTVGLKLATDASKVAIGAGAVTGYLNVVDIDPANLTMDVMIQPAKMTLSAGVTS